MSPGMLGAPHLLGNGKCVCGFGQPPMPGVGEVHRHCAGLIAKFGSMHLAVGSSWGMDM